MIQILLSCNLYRTLHHQQEGLFPIFKIQYTCPQVRLSLLSYSFFTHRLKIAQLMPGLKRICPLSLPYPQHSIQYCPYKRLCLHHKIYHTYQTYQICYRLPPFSYLCDTWQKLANRNFGHATLTAHISQIYLCTICIDPLCLICPNIILNYYEPYHLIHRGPLLS